jgi:hypothetical protein
MDTRSPSICKTKRLRNRIKVSDLALTTDLWSWLPQVAIVSSILAVASVFLFPLPLEFPMDDSYIHFVYAGNLAERGRLFFNDPGEKGVGSSSLLWVLILAAAQWFGLSMHWAAKVVGLASLAILGVGLYHLLRPLLLPWVALAGALLVTLSGHMIWFALSGMETMLFLALGILALLCYREQRWGWLGVALGVLVITRIEGVILVLVIVGFDIWRYKTMRRGLLVAGALSALICAPWILYLWLRTGYFLPTSGIGRHFSNILSIQIASGRVESLAWLSRFPGLAYPLIWIGYAVEFILGGFALPAPYLEINPGLGPYGYKLSIWAILGLATVVLPLLWISFRRLVIFLKRRGWVTDKARLPLIIFLAWMILHNLGYMIYLPIIGSASRYASLNHIALWLALGLGVWYARHSRWNYWFAAGLTIIALANTVYWNRVYDSNIDHMLNVRIAAGNYIREQIPTNETCAAFDVGALRYYSQRPLVDLGGLVDPDLMEWYQSGRFDQYLTENNVSCLVIPGQSGTTADGVIDILKESGLSQSNLYKLQREKVFQIDRQRWLIGYLPTINYQATVTIYKLLEIDGG